MTSSALSNNPVHLQNALRNLEDRCQKLQRRTDSLQSENERLLNSRSELLTEVERLQEQQIRLRERNLRLTQEFHSKQQECSLLAEKLTMFARGKMSNVKLDQDGYKVELSGVREDVEPTSSTDSLETVELQGGPTQKHKNLRHGKRTLSEPNLSVIQHELDMVRKGLWSQAIENNGKAATVEELSSKIISNLKRGQSELEAQFTRMVEVQRNSLDAVQELSCFSDDMEFEDELDPRRSIERCTAGATALQDKLIKQNELLKKLHQVLKTTPAAVENPAMSVVTQTSFNLSDSMVNSSVWRNMQTDRVCPLCENIFPTLISQEEFEDHVMEHFNGDDADTLLPEFEIL